MKPIFIIFISLLSFYSIQSSAQTYKCSSGNKTVFSDKPCSGDAKKIYEGGNSDTTANSAGGGPKETGAKNCKTGAPKYVAWKDSESIRIGEPIGGEMEVIDYADTKIGARRYSVYVNAKNIYGAYVGEKPIICFTSQDGMRILKVDSSNFN